MISFSKRLIFPYISASKNNNAFYFNSNHIKYHISNSNKPSENNSSQIYGQGRKNDSAHFQTQLQNIQFLFPFQFTLQANNFKYYDPRFTQHPIKRNLQSGQKQHMIYVLDNVQTCLNNGLSPISPNKSYIVEATKNYVHPLLSSKFQHFLSQNKSAQISVKFEINKQSIQKSQGYMQIQSKNVQESSSLNFMKLRYIHEYNLQRQKQLLMVSQKKKKPKKSNQQLLKLDVKQMMEQKSNKKQIKEMLEQMQKQKNNDSERAVNFLISKLKSLANKKDNKQKRQQQNYLTSELVKGKIKCSVFYKNKIISQQQTDLYTKWMYLVQKNEPQSIKKSRKRILYDFQFWNRGTFFQVKNWVTDFAN